MSERFVLRGNSIGIPEKEWPPLLRDNAASKKTMQMVVDALNAIPGARQKAIARAEREVVKQALDIHEKRYFTREFIFSVNALLKLSGRVVTSE